MTPRRRLIFWIAATSTMLVLTACSGTSSNLPVARAGQTLSVTVTELERLPELRYSTIDPEGVIRRWRLLPSGERLELVLVRLTVGNHTAIKAIIDVDQQAAELRDFLRETYFPMDLSGRLFQDLRDQPEATVRMDEGQCFDPVRMYISPGTKVNWVNEGSTVHYLNLGPADESLSPIEPGASYSRAFGEPGLWNYQCGAEGLSEDASDEGPVLQSARIVVEEDRIEGSVEERTMVFIEGPFELRKGMGIDGWMVFEAPQGTEFRDFRWRAADSITISF
jgi:hypothetical protein